MIVIFEYASLHRSLTFVKKAALTPVIGYANDVPTRRQPDWWDFAERV
jgi:hypothetical protein